MVTKTTVGVTFKGKPLTLIGQLPRIGQMAPDAEVVANDLSAVHLHQYRGKKLIVSSVPSLDTSVCSTETRRFDEEAAKLAEDVQILTISMDLPFAQSRWCGAVGIKHIQTLSDYKSAEFGKNYGVLILELRLLARAVFIIDPEGILRYTQLVEEMTNEPDYADVLGALKKLSSSKELLVPRQN